MADQAINAISTKTAPETSDQLLLVGTGEPQLIDYDKLADAILNKITSKNYALDAGTMTLPAALNALNGNRLIGKSKVLSKNEVWNFSISYNCILMFCPSNEILSTVILSSNRYYNIGTGRLDAVSISVKNSTVKLTSLVDWPVRYNIIGTINEQI